MDELAVLNPQYPGRPRCFKKEYSAKSEFCQNVCKHAQDCANPAYTHQSWVDVPEQGAVAVGVENDGQITL